MLYKESHKEQLPKEQKRMQCSSTYIMSYIIEQRATIKESSVIARL
jgi:hypothetical protein